MKRPAWLRDIREPKFCRGCGHRLAHRAVRTGRFHRYTGEPEWFSSLTCPNESFIYSRDHDEWVRGPIGWVSAWGNGRLGYRYAA